MMINRFISDSQRRITKSPLVIKACGPDYMQRALKRSVSFFMCARAPRIFCPGGRSLSLLQTPRWCKRKNYFSLAAGNLAERAQGARFTIYFRDYPFCWAWPVELTSALGEYYQKSPEHKRVLLPCQNPFCVRFRQGVCVRTFNNERLTTFSVSVYDHLKVSGARYELLNMGSALADSRPDGVFAERRRFMGLVFPALEHNSVRADARN